jgi:CHASE3 domain sensor protein
MSTVEINKFENSSDNQRGKILLLFILVAVVTLIPYLVIMLWEILVINKTTFLYQHLRTICKLPSEVKNSLLF